MQRVIIKAEPVDEEAGSDWMVHVRAVTPDAADADVVPPYAVAAVTVAGRWVPCTPPGRAPAAGEPHAALCAGDVDAIGELLDRLAARRTENDDVARYGRWLFECLLAPAWDTISALPDVTAERAVELALWWDVGSDLHQLVWESMHDGRATLAGHPDLLVAVSRLVPAPDPQVETITGIPKVLFAAGAALSDPVIRPGAMFMGLLRSLDANGQCQARAVQAVSIDKLHDECTSFRPDVVHLVAHGVLLGDGRAALMLRDGSEGQREADADALITALSAPGVPSAVVLSACSTATPTDASPLAAQLVAAGVPIVSAMAGEVTEPACRLYTRRLANAVHEGLPLVPASAEGRRAALLNSPEPSAELDWALPALFLAEGVDPRQRLVDSTRARRLIDLAGPLDLRREPVFIGREDIVTAADRLVADSGVAVLGVLATGSTSGLGGTRLLREIGWRVLRAGHLPLMLGPYADGAALQTARALVTELLQKILQIREHMALPPEMPLTLQAGDDIAAGLANTLGALPAALALDRVLERLAAYRRQTADVDPDRARQLLAADLAAVAEASAAWGPPFGTHSRVVLLCDDVHAWGPPATPGVPGSLSALDCLLAMTRDGVGVAGRPVPVVLTGSKTAGAGQTLDKWSGSGRGGLFIYPLEQLGEKEAVLGYQWVLLHPWTTKPVDLLEFQQVYTAAPGKQADWEGGLMDVSRYPKDIDEELYIAARLARRWHVARSDDDEAAWRRYAAGQLGGQQ